MSNWMIVQIVVEIALLVFGLTGLFFAFRELPEVWNCDKEEDDISSLHPSSIVYTEGVFDKYQFDIKESNELTKKMIMADSCDPGFDKTYPLFDYKFLRRNDEQIRYH